MLRTCREKKRLESWLKLMGNFVFTQYSGEDAGSVLVALLTGEDDVIEPLAKAVVEVETKTERVVGFMPEPEQEEDDDDEGE